MGTLGVLQFTDCLALGLFDRLYVGRQARNITALVLGWVEDSVVRSDRRGFGVDESGPPEMQGTPAQRASLPEQPDRA